MTTTTKEYVSVTDTAKMLRTALKANFPGIKFSVRSSSYSGGASIRVNWTDGPNTSAVDTIAQRYAGCSFDGMTDSKNYHSTILVGEQGPRVVQFGANFVFCSREVSNFAALVPEAEAIIRKGCVLDDNGQRFGNDWVDTLAKGMVWALDFTKGETLETTFRRVVLRQAV